MSTICHPPRRVGCQMPGSGVVRVRCEICGNYYLRKDGERPQAAQPVVSQPACAPANERIGLIRKIWRWLY